MNVWDQALVGISVLALLIGWLSPQYVAKLWAPALGNFLEECPLTAGALPQCFWMLLLIPSVLRRTSSSSDIADDQHERCDRKARAEWALALPLGLFVIVVHMMWYSSFSKTNVATNTLLWNTDTVTTPVISFIAARERPTVSALLGGVLGLAGAGLAAGSSTTGDTPLGCGLCLAASLGYAINTVVVEKARDPDMVPVTRLLGLEGLVALLIMILAVAGAWVFSPGAVEQWVQGLPPIGLVAFMGISSLTLNVGWLWCTELCGAFCTVMVACSTIPLTLALDLVLIGTTPSAHATVGSVLVLLGFAISSSRFFPIATGGMLACFGDFYKLAQLPGKPSSDDLTAPFLAAKAEV